VYAQSRVMNWSPSLPDCPRPSIGIFGEIPPIELECLQSPDIIVSNACFTDMDAEVLRLVYTHARPGIPDTFAAPVRSRSYRLWSRQGQGQRQGSRPESKVLILIVQYSQISHLRRKSSRLYESRNRSQLDTNSLN
jgi:hypothetical protein